MGDIQNTDPHFLKTFTNDYLTIINSDDCNELVPILERMTEHDTYRTWISTHEEELKKRFNRDLMQERVALIVSSCNL